MDIHFLFLLQKLFWCMHNTQRTRTDSLSFIPELTQFERENRRHSQEKSNTMAEQREEERTLLDFSMLGLDGT